MNPNILTTDECALVGAIDADAYAASTVTSGWIAAKNFNRFAALIAVGDMVATATLNAKLQQATDASGTGAKDITGKAVTALTAAGTDDNKQAWINLHQDELDAQGSFTHFRLSMTLATAGADLAGYVFGLSPTYGPASDNDAASVDEIIA